MFLIQTAKIWQDCVKDSNQIMFQKVCQVARATGNLSFIRKVNIFQKWLYRKPVPFIWPGGTACLRSACDLRCLQECILLSSGLSVHEAAGPRSYQESSHTDHTLSIRPWKTGDC